MLIDLQFSCWKRPQKGHHSKISFSIRAGSLQQCCEMLCRTPSHLDSWRSQRVLWPLREEANPSVTLLDEPWGYCKQRWLQASQDSKAWQWRSGNERGRTRLLHRLSQQPSILWLLPYYEEKAQKNKQSSFPATKAFFKECKICVHEELSCIIFLG